MKRFTSRIKFENYKAILALFAIILSISPTLPAKEVSVVDFGAVADDGIDDMVAFGQAAVYCRRNPGTTLLIPPGIYNFEDSLAMDIERKAISGAYGEWVQGVLFRPDGPYVKAFDLSDCKNLVVKGAGATLMLKGWYEVITLDNCRNVSIDGLTINYKRPASTQGVIVNSNKEYFDIVIDPVKYCFLDSLITGRVHFHDHIRNRVYTGGVGKKERISDTIIRMYSTVNPALGDVAILRHGGHYRPAVMVKESKDIFLKNVCIHTHAGMGIVGHRSENIDIDNLQIIPEPGSVSSTNTDATHFTSCCGNLTISNSKFRGQGDDCTNIHNYYYRIYPQGGRRVEIKIENADLHAQSLDYPEVGDSMVVLSRTDMKELGRYSVSKVDKSEKDWKVIIELDKELKGFDRDNHVMANLTRFPKVRILNNMVMSHLARAFLVKGHDVVISGNFISGSNDSAIKLGAELGWNESGPAYNVLIENNYIYGCGYGSDSSRPSCVMLSTEASERPPFVNHDIVIRNNVFDTDKSNMVSIKDAENVLISDNRTNHPDYVRLINSRNVNVDGVVKNSED